jgi:hypothetical protein
MRRSSRPGRFLLFIPLFILGVFVFGTIVMLLWNNVLAPVAQISTITFWQALGILILSKILFGGFRGGGWGPRRSYWRQRMMQKWDNMTPEEREKFKTEWRNRCGRWGYSPESEGGSQESQGNAASQI